MQNGTVRDADDTERCPECETPAARTGPRSWVCHRCSVEWEADP